MNFSHVCPTACHSPKKKQQFNSFNSTLCANTFCFKITLPSKKNGQTKKPLLLLGKKKKQGFFLPNFGKKATSMKTFFCHLYVLSDLLPFSVCLWEPFCTFFNLITNTFKRFFVRGFYGKNLVRFVSFGEHERFGSCVVPKRHFCPSVRCMALQPESGIERIVPIISFAIYKRR